MFAPIRQQFGTPARDWMGPLPHPALTRMFASLNSPGLQWYWKADFFAALPSGDHYVAFMESADFAKSLGQFARSQDEFDLWFKRRLNDPAPDMKLPELVSSYEA